MVVLGGGRGGALEKDGKYSSWLCIVWHDLIGNIAGMLGGLGRISLPKTILYSTLNPIQSMETQTISSHGGISWTGTGECRNAETPNVVTK